ncbi:mechanosensitive ion channel family protein [Kribbella sp. CA-294648]|uniref:mechanosensitive ion channel family protein n=1 Tax=Kribbella sp. CA-294648 TaxID=3239948 RepID=UPI003D939D04
MDIEQGLNDAWSAIATFVPKLVIFLAILVIGWIIAKVVAKVVNAALERVGFDRAVERGGIKQALARSQYDASDIIAKLVYYAILLITLQIGFGVWGPNPVSDLLTDIVAWLPRAAVAIIIVVIAGAVARAVKDLVGNALSGLSYGKTLATIASVFIWALGIIAALNQIGVATTVTTPVLIAVLATVGGVIVVGAGGGLIRPMQQRWERWLDRADSELPAARAQAEAYQRGREDAAAGTTTGQPTGQPASVSASGSMSGQSATGEHMAGQHAAGQPMTGYTTPSQTTPGQSMPGQSGSGQSGSGQSGSGSSSTSGTRPTGGSTGEPGYDNPNRY